MTDVPTPSIWNSTAVRVAAGATAVLFALQVVLVVWFLLVYESAETGSQSAIATAIIGLTGAAVTAAVSTLGLLVRNAIDTRSANLADTAENRLNLEASLQAVKLLTNEDGTAPAEPLQCGGALLALVDLGRISLAVNLIEDLLNRRQIPPDVASHVIDAALRSGDHASSGVAAGALAIYAAYFVHPAEGKTYIPTAIRSWDTSKTSLTLRADYTAFLVLCARAVQDQCESGEVEPSDRDETLSVVATIAYNALVNEQSAPHANRDPEAAIINTLSRLIVTLKPAWSGDSPRGFMESGYEGKPITFGDMSAVVRHHVPTVSLYILDGDLRRLEHWVKSEFATSHPSGSSPPA